MGVEYDENVFYGHLIKGDLSSALGYLKKFPEQAGLYGRYRSVFEQGHNIAYDADSYLNELLAVYQQYYRDVFYLNMNASEAAERMKRRFSALFDTVDQDRYC